MLDGESRIAATQIGLIEARREEEATLAESSG
jgi:hypothetical protein